MERADFLKTLVGLPLVGTIAAKRLQKTEQRPHYLLNKFYVAGFQYYEGPSVIEDIQPGELLRLTAVRGNDYDKFAVKLAWDDIMLGHMPRSDNKHISRLLQQDVKLDCKVVQVNPYRETWEMLKVSVYL